MSTDLLMVMIITLGVGLIVMFFIMEVLLEKTRSLEAELKKRANQARKTSIDVQKCLYQNMRLNEMTLSGQHAMQRIDEIEDLLRRVSVKQMIEDKEDKE